jgi:Tol biopolymer transport system component
MQTMIRTIRFLLILGTCLALMPAQLSAQAFGRNKVNYETFDFDVLQTSNLEIYYYTKNDQVLEDLASYSEMWYQMHQATLRDTIVQKNPLIFYNNFADFQQTNTISGAVGVGTGGVTEAFKNRVIMPVAMSNQQTVQVLGHEMVHAYQFNTVINGDSTSLQNLGNLPLWIVEGMAEYMSIGSVDPHTAMWMRDAVLNDDVPSLKDMYNPTYFPYRYGHAFWSFFTGLLGDGKIQPFFKAVALYGVEQACITELGLPIDSLSARWERSLKETFAPFVEDMDDGIVGRAIINEKDGGRMNISPSISPNGRYVIFLSEKNLFSTDVFLADVNSGEILKTLASSNREGNVDDFNFIESSGTWSPDSKRVAFVGFKKGSNVLLIKNIENGRTEEEIFIKDLPAFANPSWSPDGDKIVVSGQKEGQTDLYLYNLKTKEVTQLTNDVNSELHPSWSPDGSYIVYASDQLAMSRGRTYGRLTFNLAKMDILTQSVELIDVFPGADNLNPVVDENGDIVFLSNRDGYRNMYRFETGTQKVYQLTDIATGISGISHYSPAISIDRRRNRVLYTHYNKRSYSIFRARSEDLLQEEVDPNEVTYEAAFLPRPNNEMESLVDRFIRSQDQYGNLAVGNMEEIPFKKKFQLDYVGGGAGVGVGTSNTFGTTTGAAGAVDLLFSDILGNNQFYISAALNGEIQDFGGSVAYINRKRQLNWGASLSHIPFRQTGGGFAGLDTLPCEDCGDLGLYERWDFAVNRIFEDKVSLFTQYPFSTTLRVEADADLSYYSSSTTLFSNYYNGFGNLVFQERDRLENDNPNDIFSQGFALGSVGAAFVGDNSSFGMTAPLNGQRFRFGARQYFGEFSYTSPYLDYRIYRFYKPIGFAFRAMHLGRYGQDADVFFPYYVGSPWFVRGLGAQAREDLQVTGEITDDNLFGSKMFVSNFEVRIPFTGPKQLALLKSGFLFSDLNFFVDAGLVWNDFEQFDTDNNLSGFSDAKPVLTAGVSLRANVFGALIIEPYYAKPLGTDIPFSFGLNIVPGW